MNLIIDQGNTITKFAVYSEETLIRTFEAFDIEEKDVERVISDDNIINCILSSVRIIDSKIKEYLNKRFTMFIELNYNTKLPLKVNYKTPQTLGCDRVAALVGVLNESGKSGAIVIDAGTAITFDFLNGRKEFEGGNISPGMMLRFKALNQFTGKLPLVDSSGDIPVIGYDTQTAIRSGVIDGICREIEGFIADIKATHPTVLVFLTGGDSIFLSERLKSHIFVDKNIVLRGLNRILNYNVER